ncbi:Chitobiosyldiphosphodolichol beta-mannosyltransferase, family GT33 [Ectocarpus siliculosus]|uniref:Chitobiosyldiphosphodolichol beta-mannosyltransferase, family GT33 n=1 Tax=Ectocarpus siliculosus TaxID=2880 RepID=D7FIM2_ECTSI|nr:Chitobiosyldiphosphodolichol beta-mannosyltransferase, family GT33 [Ectocarpus siliculosus]|eukprot:CBJ28840.1 Chitobiosyldiphosphodolichol beta-mannosyltransferase, family GT33 [Ectocarpus siliculosus]
MGARASVPADRTTGKPPRPLRPASRRAATAGILEHLDCKHVVILVLGDVGRSPRMQYHAMSLASHGVRVTLIGYSGERCISAVEDSPRVDTSRRFDPPLSGPWGKSLKRRAYLLFAGVKAVALLVRVMYELVLVAGRRGAGGGAVADSGGFGDALRPDAILVQNPPSLPGLACVYLACLLRRCAMVLDWHNLGFTMFGCGPRHPLVWITRRAEGFFGRRATVNLTVSHAMRNWIKENFGVPEGYVVYDQPPEFFRAPTVPERHELFTRLTRTNPDFADAIRALTLASLRGELSAIGGGGGEGDGNDRLGHGNDGNDGTGRPHPKKARGHSDDNSGSGRSNSDSGGNREVTEVTPPPIARTPPAEWEEGDPAGQERTLFTTRSADGVYELRRDRPALLVSSTSWTPDEDFSVLLEALRRFDLRTASGASPTLPLVMVVVTGKGPDKAKYVARMRAARMSRVAVCTAWLEPEDYPLLLGSADLGICLHTSTSGVDLPMKVVDMFGCGVPVCAVHFECLKELVQHGYNGCVFRDSTELALQLEALLDGFPRGGSELDGYRSNVKEVQRWRENWDEYAWPIFSKIGRLRAGPTNTRGTGARGSPRGGFFSNARGGGWSTGGLAESVVVPATMLLVLLVSVPWLSHSLESWAADGAAAADRWRRQWT